jgi:putative metalloprotease
MKYLPIILLVLYLAAMWFFSLWRLRQELNQKSTPLNHPRLTPMLERLGRAMDLPPVRAHVYEVDPVNGLAAPDGRIFLTSWMWARSRPRNWPASSPMNWAMSPTAMPGGG